MDGSVSCSTHRPRSHTLDILQAFGNDDLLFLRCLVRVGGEFLPAHSVPALYGELDPTVEFPVRTYDGPVSS